MEEYGRHRQAADDNITRRMRFECWIQRLQTYTKIAFPRQRWLCERAWKLRLYLRCLPCYKLVRHQFKGLIPILFMILRHNKVTELFYVCDCTVRFSTYCWTNCSALPNMTFLYSCDDRWLNQKPLSRGWLHSFAAAVVFCCKYFSIVRVIQVRLSFFVKGCVLCVSRKKIMSCVLKNRVPILSNNEKKIFDKSFF